MQLFLVLQVVALAAVHQALASPVASSSLPAEPSVLKVMAGSPGLLRHSWLIRRSDYRDDSYHESTDGSDGGATFSSVGSTGDGDSVDETINNGLASDNQNEAYARVPEFVAIFRILSEARGDFDPQVYARIKARLTEQFNILASRHILDKRTLLQSARIELELIDEHGFQFAGVRLFVSAALRLLV